MANNKEAEIREEVLNENKDNIDTDNFVANETGCATNVENSEFKLISNDNDTLIVLQSSQNEDEEANWPCKPSSESRKRGKYTKYPYEDKIEIGKLAAENGNIFAQRKYQYSKYPSLSESTVRSFKAIYQKEEMLKKKVLKSEKKVRGKYQTYTDKARFDIGKCAAENGNANAMKLFKSEFPGLSESTVRGFKQLYCKHFPELISTITSQPIDLKNEDDINQPQAADKNAEEKCELDASILPKKKRGRPNKIPDKLEMTIARYLQAIAEKEEKPLSYKTVIGITKGVIIAENRLLLTEFGGGLHIDKSWVQSFLRRYNISHVKTETSDEVMLQDDSQLEHTDQRSQISNEGAGDENNEPWVTPTMLMIVNTGDSGEQSKLEIGTTVEDLHAIASIASEQPNDSNGIINVKITDEGQSFISDI